MVIPVARLARRSTAVFWEKVTDFQASCFKKAPFLVRSKETSLLQCWRVVIDEAGFWSEGR
jgi:hypothetical protein